MFQTLQMANHKIRTAYGISDDHYRGNSYPPLQGLGQGNGAAPTAWAVISTPIINMMRCAGFGIKFTSALSHAPISLVCYAFVNNTDVHHSSDNIYTPREIIIDDI